MRTVYAIAFRDGSFLMVHNENRNGWEMPGGKIEEGESVRDAARREYAEEAGYRIDIVALKDIGHCDVCACILRDRLDAECEMASELFAELPDDLSFGRSEYEETVPWARSAVYGTPRI